MPLLIPRKSFDGQSVVGYSWWCPACHRLHSFNTDGNQAPLWTFNGNFESPSFSPSLRYLDETNCHTIVQNGTIYYCNDCKHALAGKTVPMVEFDTEGWCPVTTTVNGKPVAASGAKESEKGPAPTGVTASQNAGAAPAAPADAAKKQTHKAECGEVGETGEHGDLGSNAA